MTTAANRHYLTGRPFPASGGLDFYQMLAAIRDFGYAPHHVRAPDGKAKQAGFFLALCAYLRSGIPVVLRITHDGEGHAVTLAGFRGEDEEEQPPELLLEDLDGKPSFRAEGMSRLYVHDDRLGPYVRARVEFRDDDPPNLLLDPGGSAFEKFRTPATIHHALVPLYPKLRLSAEELLEFAQTRF